MDPSNISGSGQLVIPGSGKIADVVSTQTGSLYFGKQVQIIYDPKDGNFYETQFGNPNGYQLITDENIKKGYGTLYSTQITSLNNQYTASTGQPAATPPTIQPATLPPLTSNPAIAGEPVPISALPTTKGVKELSPTEGIRYPLKINLGEQDVIKFQPFEINPRGINAPNSGQLSSFTLNEISGTPKDGPVYLAVQSPISDQNSVDWGPNTLNAIDAFIFNKSYNIIGGKDVDVATELNKAAEEIYKSARENTGRLQKYLAGQAASINNILARTDGVVLNPNLELLFQGPQLRPFTFQFKMSAREKPEANAIKTIIQYFKYHMAVRREEQLLFLRSPHVFTIQYLHKQSDHPGINRIKKYCALTNCSVDYTPLGSYMTYEDGTMVAYTLSLQFQEIEPIYADDYTSIPNTEIGY